MVIPIKTYQYRDTNRYCQYVKERFSHLLSRQYPLFPIYSPTPITHNTSMKKSLAHLPQSKQDELKLIVNKIHDLVYPEKIILLGSYARGDWKDSPQYLTALTDHKDIIAQNVTQNIYHRHIKKVFPPPSQT